MTLLHTMIAGRVAALRAAETRAWPAGTLLTADDVLVAGTSLAELARTVGTPALLAGATSGTGTGAPSRRSLVVVVQVDAVIPPMHRPREVWIDAELEGCAPVLSAVRVLGRACAGHSHRYRIRPDRSESLAELVRLPADLHRHDLLAIPCTSRVALEDIRR
ncbi:hypothetical protein [Oerskovia sp. KBS0722]|uniref:hypothetical protein n=1 Tax=Oerskovia sp. KBS0722 TaxID=1179673 RepID=UPI00110F0D60|nr:hypothetical protein [Oerskovia sp. KBS0722]QDW64267.1 hypothetical protein FFI11_018715 [Oerskovia sp. KBS0722]